MYAHGFRFYFTPLTGVLFTFPSRYWFTIGRQRVFSLGGMGPPCSDKVARAPALLFVTHTSHPFAYRAITFYGQTFQSVLLGCDVIPVNWAVPRSLAATRGISVDFCSSGYLDVSVPRVCFNAPMYSVRNDRKRPGFPIRKSPDQSQFAGSPRLIACYNVLHRLLPPRHPPCALDYLNHVTRNIPFKETVRGV